jgi:hypothetical protein
MSVISKQVLAARHPEEAMTGLLPSDIEYMKALSSLPEPEYIKWKPYVERPLYDLYDMVLEVSNEVLVAAKRYAEQQERAREEQQGEEQQQAVTQRAAFVVRLLPAKPLPVSAGPK